MRYSPDKFVVEDVGVTVHCQVIVLRNQKSEVDVLNVNPASSPEFDFTPID